MVHLLRHSMEFASWKDRKPVAAALKTIYDAMDDRAADGVRPSRLAPGAANTRRSARPGAGLGRRFPFFAFPREVRRILSTTNAIEALNAKLRRAVRARGHFPHDEAALKLLFLVLNRSEKEWKMPPREWAAAKAQMAVMFGERFSLAMRA
ncbi:transposase [Labrys wisconsinensis]|nr:transposase [Labrys wisconsinensis]